MCLISWLVGNHVAFKVQCPPKVLEQNKIFSHNFKRCVNLKCHLKTIWIEDQAQRFDPYCLIPSISFCWKLVVLRGITWIMWLYKCCKFYDCPRTFGRHCISEEPRQQPSLRVYFLLRNTVNIIISSGAVFNDMTLSRSQIKTSFKRRFE